MTGDERPSSPPPLSMWSQASAWLLLLSAALAACGPRPVAVVPAPTPPAQAAASAPVVATAPVALLRQELEYLFASPVVDHALWAVEVQSLATGERLFSLNSRKLVMPASNMKIVTVAVAAERLGWDFRYETQLLTSAPVSNGTLLGDLIVVGSGDPTIGAPRRENGETDTTDVFEQWAAALRDAGIERVDGRIIGDDNAFADEPLGAGWAWDYLAYGYAAPTGALQYHRNLVVLTLTPGQVAGDPVAIEVEPVGSGLIVINRAVTAAPGTAVDIALQRLPGQSTLTVSGQVPAGTALIHRTSSVDNPTQFFVDALAAALAAEGIPVSGGGVDIDAIGDGTDLPGRDAPLRVLAAHRSPPLREIATVLMKISQNQYAESLLKTLGARTPPGTSEAGRRVVEEVLTSWGIAPGQYVVYDGSGLSRYNYVTAEMLVAILRRMYRDPRHREPFLETLPVAGVDGTLDDRLKGTRGEGMARAKTGTISNVRALSGYVETRDDEPLAFSIVANHFTTPSSVVDAIVDQAVERLANFTRR